MKKAVVSGKRQAGLVEVPDPRPKGDLVLVKVHSAPMCAEYKDFVAGNRNEYLGHEAAGEVVAVAQPGRLPGRLKVGDRVVGIPTSPCGKCPLCISGDYVFCQRRRDPDGVWGQPEGRAAFAQYILAADWVLSPIPDGVSYERASLACCALGPSFSSFDLMDLEAYDTVLVTGLGPVGLGAIVNARFRGARVIAVGSQPFRLERARQMGAAAVLDRHDAGILEKIRELTGGRGVDCAVECAGTVAAQRLCIDATRLRGKVAFVGECLDELAITVTPDLLRKGLALFGIWHYNLRNFPKIMQVIQESPVIDLLASHIVPMSEIQAAMELSASHQTAKVILDPWR